MAAGHGWPHEAEGCGGDSADVYNPTGKVGSP